MPVPAHRLVNMPVPPCRLVKPPELPESTPMNSFRTMSVPNVPVAALKLDVDSTSMTAELDFSVEMLPEAAAREANVAPVAAKEATDSAPTLPVPATSVAKEPVAAPREDTVAWSAASAAM